MRKLKFVLPIVSVILLILYFSFLVKIEEIKCVSDDDQCPDSVISILNDQSNKSIFLAKRSLARELDEDELVKNYSVRFNIPNKLIVNIKEREPEFALLTAEENSWYSIVDIEGVVIAVEESSDLDGLFVEELPNRGERLNSESLNAYKIYKNIDPYFPIERMEIRQEGSFVELERGHQAWLPKDADTQIIVGAIMVVFNRLNSSIEKSIIDNRDNQMLYNLCSGGCLVDFRFQNPVIKAKI